MQIDPAVEGLQHQGGLRLHCGPERAAEAVQIDDADEAQADLPLAACRWRRGEPRLEHRHRVAYVGKQSALNEAVTKSDVSGNECATATHYVRGATVGAFVMATGNKGQGRAAADIFGAGASGSSSSYKKKLNSGGDVKACKAIKTGLQSHRKGAARSSGSSSRARRRRGSGEGSSAAPPLENTCLEGFVPSEGRCVKKSREVARRCEPEEIADCKAQCKKGNAESCYNAGAYLQSRRQEGTSYL